MEEVSSVKLNVGVRLDETVVNRLEKAASRLGLTKSDIVTLLVIRYADTLKVS